MEIQRAAAEADLDLCTTASQKCDLANAVAESPTKRNKVDTEWSETAARSTNGGTAAVVVVGREPGEFLPDRGEKQYGTELEPGEEFFVG